MRSRHVAFVVESVYGHLVPTLGMAAELLRRGHRVSYAVRPIFERKIRQFGAEAVVYRPLENKLKVFEVMKCDPSLDAKALEALWSEVRQEEMNDTHAQLKILYGRDKPDLIVYDITNPAGRMLAKTLDVLSAEHSPLLVEKNLPGWSYDDSLVLVSIPRFFQPHPEEFDERFQFIGFIQDGRKAFFDPWPTALKDKRGILAYATTGLLPQVEFLRSVLAVFGNSSWRLILTIGDDTNVESLGPLPDNCSLNRTSANLEILETADLVIGQAGTGSTLEALYCGVPLVLVPPPLRVYEDCANRVTELGLGICIRQSDFTVERLKEGALSLLRDEKMQARLKTISKVMQQDGSPLAADLLEKRIAHN